MRSEIKVFLVKKTFQLAAIFICVIAIIVFENRLPMNIFFFVCILPVFLIALGGGVFDIWRLNKNPILSEEKWIMVPPGGRFKFPLTKDNLEVWILISGPIGRMTGKVECFTDSGLKVGCFNFEEYNFGSKTGYRSIWKNFRLRNNTENNTAQVLEVNLDFYPKLGDELETSITVIAALQLSSPRL